MAKISLALPVFNGERYLEECLNSIMGQTFEDFELVISDNASTDRTPEIVERFAAEDSRIRVLRQPSNVGAARNFNLLVGETRADMFKWCAHDDRLEPEFLEATYAALKGDPDAVLCHCHTMIHDKESNVTEVYVPQFEMAVDDPAARLREVLLYGRRCYEVFGLIRRAALERTRLIGNYRGGDNVLLYQLALLGTFKVIPRPLFILGRHRLQSSEMIQNSQAYHAWFKGRHSRISFPDWVFIAEAWRSPVHLGMPLDELARCYWELLKETYRFRGPLRQNLRVAGEMLFFGTSDPRRRRRFFDTSSR